MEPDIFSKERKRMMYHGFLRRKKKPQKGEETTYTFPEKQEDEDIVKYQQRCLEATGVKPVWTGPIKKIPVNSKCPCKSGKKYKLCCGRT